MRTESDAPDDTPAAASRGGDHDPRAVGLPALEEARLKDALRESLFGIAPAEHALKIGRFEVIDKLGEGGMGVVYAVRDPELGRTVAIKLLHERAGAPAHERRDRLRREARALAKLSHPHVVGVHEIGVHDGEVFVAMELVEGQTLEKFVTQDPAPDWRTVLALLVEAGDGLAAAHEAGLVHRDFKPQNVMVDHRGRARVLDFGLAAEDAAAGPIDPDDLERLTRTGEIRGTPAFMAPEQFEGHDADARTDQFAFCVTAYRLLFGRPPFPGDDYAALAKRVASGVVDPPTATPRGMPRSVIRTLQRGLRVDRDARFADMPTLLRELQSVPAHWSRPSLRRWGAAAVGVATLGGALAWWSLKPEVPRTCEAGRDAATALRAKVTEAAWPEVDRYLHAWRLRWDAACSHGEPGVRACLEARLEDVTGLVEESLHRELVAADRQHIFLRPLELCAPPSAREATQAIPADQREAAARIRVAAGTTRHRVTVDPPREPVGAFVGLLEEAESLGLHAVKAEVGRLASHAVKPAHRHELARTAEAAGRANDLATAVPTLAELAAIDGDPVARSNWAGQLFEALRTLPLDTRLRALAYEGIARQRALAGTTDRAYHYARVGADMGPDVGADVHARLLALASQLALSLGDADEAVDLADCYVTVAGDGDAAVRATLTRALSGRGDGDETWASSREARVVASSEIARAEVLLASEDAVAAWDVIAPEMERIEREVAPKDLKHDEAYGWLLALRAWTQWELGLLAGAEADAKAAATWGSDVRGAQILGGVVLFELGVDTKCGVPAAVAEGRMLRRRVCCGPERGLVEGWVSAWERRCKEH